MEVNLGLALGPLTSATRQKNNLGFDRFNVKHSTIGGVDLRPNIKRCFVVLVAPCITVIPATAYSGESKSKSRTHCLLCDANINGLAVY
jgi:hypothetical protein